MRIPLVEDGHAKATLVVGCLDEAIDHGVAREVQRYVRMLTGVELTISATRPAGQTAVLVGSPRTNSEIGKLEAAGHIQVSDLKPDGFVLKSLDLESGPALAVAGVDERATMYAAYDLIERLGVSFQLTSDILPTPTRNLSLPALDVRLEPAIQYRGLHMRHFVMPWMGYEDFCQLMDQMAKLKFNYLEFFWYIDSPWIEYSFRGKDVSIGELNHRESGYTAWRCETGPFSSADVLIGKEHFPQPRPCAPEFQHCQTPEEAHRVAQQLLRRMIAYAHERKIQMWLGTGDCPCLPPRVGRRVKNSKSLGPFGSIAPLGDPAGADLWTAMLESMITTYPEADGHWLWLSEGYHRNVGDADSAKVLSQYEGLRKLIPSKDELMAMGYDQYLTRYTAEHIFQADIGLIHYGKEVI